MHVVAVKVVFFVPAFHSSSPIVTVYRARLYRSIPFSLRMQQLLSHYKMLTFRRCGSDPPSRRILTCDEFFNLFIVKYILVDLQVN